jgi:murein peptide amidase A
VRRALLAAALLVLTAAPTAAAPLTGEVIGTSVQGRDIRLVRVGDPAAPRKVLVVGCIHGTERAGLPILKALRAAEPPAGVQLLLLDELNPDGCRAGTRGNAHGVDLNRNFPRDWHHLGGVYYSGPRPSSEPETRAAEALILREKPSVQIWYHQHLNWVDLQPGSNAVLMKQYATITAMRAVRTPLLAGTVARWSNHRLPGRSAFVVELHAGALTQGEVDAHVKAVLAMAQAVAPPAPTP